MFPRAPHVAIKIPSHNTRAGFSLLELAVVILIIGLLMAGLLIAREAIRTAELRRLISQTEEFAVAIKQFRDKYQDLPGDMYNVENLWGQDPGGCPATPPVPPAPDNLGRKRETCNGNGNGRIYNFPADPTDLYEVFRAFQQLSNAEMIRGTYTGVRTLAVPEDSAVIGFNIPECEVKGAGLWLSYYGYNDDTDPTYFPMRGHYLTCAGLNTSGQVKQAILSPNEAHGIDNKIDNGRPGTGRMVSTKVVACSTTTDATTATYANSDTPNICLVIIGVDNELR